MIPLEYTQAAHLKAVALQVARDVRAKYADGETPAETTIICEEVFHADREVTQVTVLEFLAILQQIADKADKRMLKYQFTKKGAKPMAVSLPSPKGGTGE